MSRIGKKPIVIPDKVQVSVAGAQVAVKGPLGSLSFTLPAGTRAEVKDGKVLVGIDGEPRLLAPAYGTARARIANLVAGVTGGFSRTLEITGLGYKAEVKGQELIMELGFSHPVKIAIPAGISMKTDPKQIQLTISGADKVMVGDLAASIRRIRPPEPYKGSGIKYQGEHIVRKAGKTAAGVAGAAGGAAAGAAKK